MPKIILALILLLVGTMAYGQTGQQEPKPQGGTITDSYGNVKAQIKK